MTKSKDALLGAQTMPKVPVPSTVARVLQGEFLISPTAEIGREVFVPARGHTL